MQRRDFLRNASVALAAFGLPALPACAAQGNQVGLRRLGQPQPFDFASLKGQARALSQAAYQSHKRTLPGPVAFAVTTLASVPPPSISACVTVCV